jgi:uncharacterized membrane-anchored protein YitT (DUF2179 family)
MSLPSHGPAPCDDADGHLVTAGPLTPPPDSAGTTADEKALRHSIAEDVQGMVLATMVASLGLAIFAKGGLMIGGMAGMAFLLHYAMGWNFGLVFVLVNLPFYWVALRRMGWEFTLKTFAAVTACGVLTDLLPRWIDFSHINPLYSAIVGGALSGLASCSSSATAPASAASASWRYLQRTRGWSAGKVQMSYDACLMVAAFFVLSPSKVLYSAIGAVVLSLVLMFNHRPGRYMGV